MNTLVNFPIAKLLKEKGFEEVTEFAYKPDGTKISFKSEGGTNANLNYLVGKNYNKFKQNSSNPLTSAPTVIEVVMWLYEKHGIWVSVYTMDKWLPNDNGKEQLFDYSLKQMKLGLIDIPKKPEEFNSPTEAYEAAIEYVLTKDF